MSFTLEKSYDIFMIPNSNERDTSSDRNKRISNIVIESFSNGGNQMNNEYGAEKQLLEAILLRYEYMERSGNFFPQTTEAFIKNNFVFESQKCYKSKVDMDTSYNPPEPSQDHWMLNTPLPKYDKIFVLTREEGVFRILNESGKYIKELDTYFLSKAKYLKDYEKMVGIVSDGPLKSLCYRRLSYLQNKFQLYLLRNEQRELHEQKSIRHRDFYNIRKVDTHIHAASSMNQKHLLRFIKRKMKTENDTVVLEKDGKKITMGETFKSLNIEPYDLNVDILDVHAYKNAFHRLDKFNHKYNPIGQSTLRQIFINTDNYVEGKYFAEILKEVFKELEESKYQHIEPRLSIYGHKKNEWSKLAKWAIKHDVWSTNSKFLIQIPRLYDIYKEKKYISNFDQLLDNIFTPLFEVTNNPSSDPDLFRFLLQITGIDSVDDESKHEYIQFDKFTPSPKDYTDAENPSYTYYMYYLYSNIAMLNAFRRLRNLNTLSFRLHSGETGHPHHLIDSFLTAESICHGLLLRKLPVLQYLFYLTKIGISMSPLANNSLLIPYHRNPLPEFLMKGLNVSLSTDDPLQFHLTKEALMEEYSIAVQVWKLSPTDMCELALNSVRQSGFEDKIKYYWLGSNFKNEGALGNDISRTNVPDIRIAFRYETLVDELSHIFKIYKK
uniref:AMP deaminase n=1 Tax=Strongyloides stercoralis TaxID=6248 RepID=A0A0K0EIC3_STRER